MGNNKWLNTVEQVSIVAAVAGTIAAEVTRQTIFVSAPLSLSLCLSLINRSRAQQANQQTVELELGQVRHDLWQLHQKVWKDEESLRERLLSLPTAPESMDLSSVRGFVESIKTELEIHLAPLQTLDVGAIHAGMTQLQTEVSELQANMDDLISQPLEISAPDLSHLQDQLHQLHQRLENSTFSSNSDVEKRLAELQGSIAHLESPLESDLIHLLDDKLEERLAELRGAIAHLEEKTATSDLNPLIETRLEEHLAEIRGVMTQSEQPVETPQASLLVSEIRNLQQRQDGLEQEIIKAVRTELQTHFSLLTEVGFNTIHTGIAGLQTEMSRVQTDLQAIANQPPVDLAPLQAEITYLNQQVTQIPIAFDPAPLEQRLEELKTVIGRLEQEAEQSPLKQDLTVFFSAMRSLYNHQTPALS